MIQPEYHRFNFCKVTENHLKSKNSSAMDEISSKLLKSIKVEISKPLKILIN